MKSKLFFVFCLILVSSFSFLVSPISVHAQTTSTWSDRCAVNEVATIQGVECLFANVLQVIVWIAGIAFLFMFITGGYQYLFSGNDPKKVAIASSTLTMAVAGLIGLIASFFILRLISNFTGINSVMNFVIPGGN